MAGLVSRKLQLSKTEQTDQELVKLAIENHDYFGQIVERYWNRLFAFVRRTVFVDKLDLENDFKNKLSLEKVEKILGNLPKKYKEVLILRFLEEKDYEEIMDILQKSKGAVASLINRGRKKLLEEIGRQGKGVDNF